MDVTSSASCYLFRNSAQEAGIDTGLMRYISLDLFPPVFLVFWFFFFLGIKSCPLSANLYDSFLNSKLRFCLSTWWNFPLFLPFFFYFFYVDFDFAYSTSGYPIHRPYFFKVIHHGDVGRFHFDYEEVPPYPRQPVNLTT